MSGWYWRLIAFKAAFVLTCFVSYLRADDTVPKLPFCNPTTPKDSTPNFNDLVIVSTLDGKITAFSTESGVKAWDLETQPLLSSNIHNVELSSGGKFVRLVPSLRGNLFSLSGDSIEPLPFDAEQLLSSSFKYSEDLVIAGARETIWLGVDAHSGSVIYECGSSGCNSEQQTASAGRDVIVLRRHSNTVRALDPRSGSEKWNFSVAEHQLALSRRECAEKNKPQVVAISVALPEGVVVLKNPESKMPLWQHKLDAPVVDMWRLQGGSLEHLDILLEAAQALVEVNSPNSPSLYLGVHDSQFYIQESAFYAQKLETAVASKPIPWKLKKSRPLLSDGSTALSPAEEHNSLSVVTAPGDIGKSKDHGFFIYLPDTCEEIAVTEDMLPEIVLPNNSNEAAHHHVHVHVYSLWFWWKEVLVIAISSALLLNLMIWPRFFAPKAPPPAPLPVNQEYIIVERHYDKQPSNDYSGRYENDFDTVKYLGKGGFGVVFEAKNKIDHCSYAVKRITLPRRKCARERVLREVRALAKLEHEHIVRYFNAWVEEPPPHWQEQRDRQIMQELGGGVSLAMSEDYTATRPSIPPIESKSTPRGDVMLNLHKSIDECFDAMDYDKKLSEPRRLRSQSCSDSFTVVFDDNASNNPHLTSDDIKFSDVTGHTSKHVGSGDNDDSFIVFTNSPQEHSGLSEARKDVTNRMLEQIKESESYKENSHIKKKKKGHTRHWSLDMCVSEESKKYLYIQMQLCRRDSLHDWLSNNSTCGARRDLIKPLFDQIVSAVEYVHLAGLIHRDLKPRNIFFAPDGKVKVGDFGLVTSMTDNSKDGPTELDAHALHTHKVGTHLYMSPEQLQGHPYNYKVDIYSLGLVLFELLYPFRTDAERIKCLMNVRHGKYPEEFIKDFPNEAEVVKLMLSNNPKQRPTASGVRARAPLYQCTEEQWHFALPTMVMC